MRRDGMLEDRKAASTNDSVVYENNPEEEETGQGRSDVAYGNEDDDVRFDINEENLKGSHEGYQIEGDNEAKVIDEKLAKAAAEEAGDNFANISDETANEKYERDQVDQGLAESIQSDEGMLADSGQKDKVE